MGQRTRKQRKSEDIQPGADGRIEKREERRERRRRGRSEAGMKEKGEGSSKDLSLHYFIVREPEKCWRRGCESVRFRR